MKPVVVIIGRPNLGKATLFNRLTKTNAALVDDVPGITRDRHYGDAKWNRIPFTVVDTGGFMGDDDDIFMGNIRFQIEQAVAEADAVMLVFDGKYGFSPFDRDMMEFLREAPPKVYYLVNKIDGPERQDEIYDFHVLGLEKLYPVSGAHGFGLRDFLDDLVEGLPESGDDLGRDMVKVAVVGKPNVGKSTLINRILGEERVIVSEVPGTTRSSLDVICHKGGRDYLMIDTAGLRKKSKTYEKIEKFSAIKTLKSLDRCDVALILVDAVQGLRQQDITIAGYALERGCGCVFLINKWDLAKKGEKTAKDFYDDLKYSAKFLSFAPSLAISAHTGWRTSKIFDLIDDVYAQYSVSIKTGVLNRIIGKATSRNEPSLHQGRRLKFNYATQIANCPPTFVCFVNFPKGVHFSYKRYLLNCIRREAGLDKTPLRLVFREKTGRTEFSRPKQRRGKRVKSWQK